MARTTEEVLAHIDAIKNEDVFGFMLSDLVSYLPFASAKQFLKEGVSAADWVARSVAPEDVKQQIFEYMPFAWDKANNRRGLSAGRSIQHMQVWLWMLGMEQAANQISDYDCYGKPQLRAICEHFGWEWRNLDDNLWSNSEEFTGDPAPETGITLSDKISEAA